MFPLKITCRFRSTLGVLLNKLLVHEYFSAYVTDDYYETGPLPIPFTYGILSWSDLTIGRWSHNRHSTSPWITPKNHSDDSVNCTNDMWRYNTTSRMWAWISGSAWYNYVTNAQCNTAVASTRGMSSATMYPGSRYAAASYYDDKNRIFYLFGGHAYVCSFTTTGYGKSIQCPKFIARRVISDIVAYVSLS